jgi:hypothetical protein
MKNYISVLSITTLCNLIDTNNISEEPVASIISSEDGGSMFL